MFGSADSYSRFSLVWSILIFISVPLARSVQSLVQDALGREAFRYGTLAFLFALLLFLPFLLKRNNLFHPKRVVGLFFIFIAGSFAVFFLAHSPEESFHFVEYGILGWALYGYFSRRTTGIDLILSVLALGAIVGFLDETFQWLIPNRYWDYKDILINIVGVSLGGLTGSVIFLNKPEKTNECTNRRRTFIAVTTFLLLLIASLHNTPAHVKQYTTIFPLVDFLDNNPSVMAEYGYLHEGSGVSFYSRLALKELLSRSHKDIVVTKGFCHDDLYGAILLEYTGHDYPYLHEGRVHLFRRNSYAAQLKAHPQNESLKNIVTGEEFILQKYYTSLWEKCSLTENNNSTKPQHYESPVSSHLITWISYNSVIILSVIILLLSVVGFHLLITKCYYDKENM